MCLHLIFLAECLQGETTKGAQTAPGSCGRQSTGALLAWGNWDWERFPWGAGHRLDGAEVLLGRRRGQGVWGHKGEGEALQPAEVGNWKTHTQLHCKWLLFQANNRFSTERSLPPVDHWPSQQVGESRWPTLHKLFQLLFVCSLSDILRPASTSIRFGNLKRLLPAPLPCKRCFTFIFTVLSHNIKERIFNLYDTDQEDLPATSSVLKRLRKSGVQANVRPDKRTTLFVADWVCVWMNFIEGQERPSAHSTESWH